MGWRRTSRRQSWVGAARGQQPRRPARWDPGPAGKMSPTRKSGPWSAVPPPSGKKSGIVYGVFVAGLRVLREVMVPRTRSTSFPVTSRPPRRPAGDAGTALALPGDRRVRRGHPRLRPRPRPARHHRSRPDAPVHNLTRPIPQLPETVRVLRALGDMRGSGSHLAIVVHEYGG